MAALAKDRHTKRLGVPVPTTVNVGVVASDIIYGGSLVTVNTAGYAAPAAAGTQGVACGVAQERADNASGSAGDKTVNLFMGGIFEFATDVAFDVLTDQGAKVYASDDQTVTKDAVGNQYVGTVVQLTSTTKVYVKVEGFMSADDGSAVELAAADGAVSIPNRGRKVVLITKAGVAALTLAAPTSGDHDGVEIVFVATTANAHTVTATTIGFNAGDAASDVGTFGGAIGDGLAVVAHGGEWYVTGNINVTLA